MQKKDLDRRIVETEQALRLYMTNSLNTMLGKNRDRGDCWRNSGILGQFIEIHSMYFRLRNLIYEMEIPNPDSPEWKKWSDQVQNALEDLRNFTMLCELCLQEKNPRGEKYAVKEQL